MDHTVLPAKLHHACLYFPAAEHHRLLAGTHFAVPRRVEGWVDLGGWLHIETRWNVLWESTTPRESEIWGFCRQHLVTLATTTVRSIKCKQSPVYEVFRPLLPHPPADRNETRTCCIKIVSSCTCASLLYSCVFQGLRSSRAHILTYTKPKNSCHNLHCKFVTAVFPLNRWQAVLPRPFIQLCLGGRLRGKIFLWARDYFSFMFSSQQCQSIWNARRAFGGAHISPIDLDL